MEILSILILLVIVAVAILRQVNQYERGVMFTMGRYTGIREAGWRIVIPVFQRMHKVDMRVKAVDVPQQQAITKDNISVGVNAVIYYKVSHADQAVLNVEDYFYAISQLAQTTMVKWNSMNSLPAAKKYQIKFVRLLTLRAMIGVSR